MLIGGVVSRDGSADPAYGLTGFSVVNGFFMAGADGTGAIALGATCPRFPDAEIMSPVYGFIHATSPLQSMTFQFDGLALTSSGAVVLLACAIEMVGRPADATGLQPCGPQLPVCLIILASVMPPRASTRYSSPWITRSPTHPSARSAAVTAMNVSPYRFNRTSHNFSMMAASTVKGECAHQAFIRRQNSMGCF